MSKYWLIVAALSTLIGQAQPAQDTKEEGTLPSARAARAARDKATKLRQEAETATATADALEEQLKTARAAEKLATAAATKAETDAETAEAAAIRDIDSLIQRLEASRTLLQPKKSSPKQKRSSPESELSKTTKQPPKKANSGKDDDLPTLQPSKAIKTVRVVPDAGIPFKVKDQKQPGNKTPVKTKSSELKEATIIVRTYKDAELFFDDNPTTSKGPTRTFKTQPFAVDTPNQYTIKVVWQEDGKENVLERKIAVTAGGETRVNMLKDEE